MRGFARVDGLDACGGDSGGGWYWLSGDIRTAYGIHHGSSTRLPRRLRRLHVLVQRVADDPVRRSLPGVNIETK